MNYHVHIAHLQQPPNQPCYHYYDPKLILISYYFQISKQCLNFPNSHIFTACLKQDLTKAHRF